MPGRPFSKDKEKHNQDSSEYRLPDQIIIDDNGEDSPAPVSDFFDGTEGRTNQEQSPSSKPPISLRFLSFLGLIFCSIYGLGILFFAFLTSFFALVTLFQSPDINQGCIKYWKYALNTILAGVGFALGIVFPPFGLGFLVIYFSLQGEEMDTDILSKIIQRSFDRR